MAKAKRSGKKQKTAGKQAKKPSAGNANRNAAKKKAVSATKGKTRKPKGPAAKKLAVKKGPATMAKKSAPRKASKPLAKKAKSAAKKPKAVKKPAAKATRKPAAKKPVAREQTPDTAPVMSIGVAEPMDVETVRDMPVSNETMPPSQPDAENGNASDDMIGNGVESGSDAGNLHDEDDDVEWDDEDADDQPPP